MELPPGRSKNSPAPPRTTSRWRPVTSYATPNRGANASAGQLYVVFEMPCPDRNSPFVVLPEPGTSVPMASTELGPSDSPVRGFLACRSPAAHEAALFGHIARYSDGA